MKTPEKVNNIFRSPGVPGICEAAELLVVFSQLSRFMGSGGQSGAQRRSCR